MRLIGDPDRGQLARAMQLGNVDRIAPVGFDPIAWFAGDQRRRDYGTFVAHCTQLSLDAIAARSGFVAKSQISLSCRPVSPSAPSMWPGCWRSFRVRAP